MNIYGAIIAAIAIANSGVNVNNGHKRQKTRSQFFYLDPKFQGSVAFHPPSIRLHAAFRTAHMGKLVKGIIKNKNRALRS